MKPLYIQATEISPEVNLNPQENIFTITGKSIPHDGKDFYEPVLKWLEAFSLECSAPVNFVFNLEFFNITSSKMLLFILYKLNEMRASGNDVRITWYFRNDDDEMYEVGEDYAFMVEVPFTFKKVEEKPQNPLEKELHRPNRLN